MKYRSLIYVCFMRSNLVAHWYILSLQAIKQNHWTAKCRSLTHIYFMRSNFLSHRSVITSMTFLHQIVLKILSKLIGQYFMRSIFVSYWSVIRSVTFIYPTVLKICSKITGPCNIGHSDIHLIKKKVKIIRIIDAWPDVFGRVSHKRKRRLFF